MDPCGLIPRPAFRFACQGNISWSDILRITQKSGVDARGDLDFEMQKKRHSDSKNEMRGRDWPGLDLIC
jgi:hypothetical protein